VRCGGLAVGKCEHRPPVTGHNNWCVRGSKRATEVAATRGRRYGDKAAFGRVKRFGGIWPRCHWWERLGGEVGGRARTRRSVRADANRAQIWTAFASPQTAHLKCVGPLVWVFPCPGHFRTTFGRPWSVWVGPLEMP
jgi:hypothetical protein